MQSKSELKRSGDIMIELPEAVNISKQISSTITGKKVVGIVSGHSPHKFAWYYGDQNRYSGILVGQKIAGAEAYGGFVEVSVGKMKVLFGEGVNLRFHDKEGSRPTKHQFLIEFDDRTALSAVVQMYGGMGAFADGELDNPYYLTAKAKPSPLSMAFDEDYFHSLVNATEVQKLSLKAFLATEQRIPGLGNGVLQDILFNAGLHPKKKVGTLDKEDIRSVFQSVKTTLGRMSAGGGRDTEKDIFGRAGSYVTILSKNTAGTPCPLCGTTIKKESYLGGSIYHCGKCQRL
ncbi:MAG: formamidopyrimidine/5-formyluracil/ 5-hydroxymethyluracil DNA glycosylase [Methanomassiliicoccales archaeon PtaU1.Bin124]|nr:MAG: formamidopyrimidine/5-formyluracil/ 5-hydroxymethyluracil DNA glycosylase [Methanomassiliicoccales archaeon PtaU1.Bin124]